MQAHPEASRPAHEGPNVGWTTGFMVSPEDAKQLPAVGGCQLPLNKSAAVVPGVAVVCASRGSIISVSSRWR